MKQSLILLAFLECFVVAAFLIFTGVEYVQCCNALPDESLDIPGVVASVVKDSLSAVPVTLVPHVCSIGSVLGDHSHAKVFNIPGTFERTPLTVIRI